MTDEPNTPKPKPAWSHVFPARYPGICRACGDEIESGDLIAWGADSGFWACQHCAEATR